MRGTIHDTDGGGIGTGGGLISNGTAAVAVRADRTFLIAKKDTNGPARRRPERGSAFKNHHTNRGIK